MIVLRWAVAAVCAVLSLMYLALLVQVLPGWALLVAVAVYVLVVRALLARRRGGPRGVAREFAE